MERTQNPPAKEGSLAKMLSIHMIFLRVWTYLEFQDILSCSRVSKWWFYQSREYMYRHRVCFIADPPTPKLCTCVSLKTVNALLHSRIPSSIVPFNSERMPPYPFCICSDKNPSIPGPLERFPMIFSEVTFKRIDLKFGNGSRGGRPLSSRARYVLELVRHSWDTLETLVLGECVLSLEDWGLSNSKQGQDEPSAVPTFSLNCMKKSRSVDASRVTFPKLKVLEFYSCSPPREQLKTFEFFLRSAPNLQKVQGCVSRLLLESVLSRSDYRLLRGIKIDTQTLDHVTWQNLVQGKSELRSWNIYDWVSIPEGSTTVRQEIKIDHELLVGMLNNSCRSLQTLECTLSQLLMLTYSESLVPLLSVSQLTMTSWEVKQRRSVYLLLLSSINFDFIFPNLKQLSVMDSKNCNMTSELLLDALRVKPRLTRTNCMPSPVKTVLWVSSSFMKSIKSIMKVFPSVERFEVRFDLLCRTYAVFSKTFGWKLKTLRVYRVTRSRCSFWDGLFSSLQTGLQQMELEFTGHCDTIHVKWKENENGEVTVPFISKFCLQQICEQHPGLVINLKSDFKIADESFNELMGCAKIDTQLLQHVHHSHGMQTHIYLSDHCYSCRLQFPLQSHVYTNKQEAHALDNPGIIANITC